MGSDYSKGKRYAEAAKYGQVFTQTDKSAYCGGETVTGRIYLNRIQPFPGKKLFLKLKGKEITHIVRNEQRGKVRYEIHYSDKEDIIKLLVPVHTFDSYQSGQYMIPFAFVLPPNLPNTFHQEGNRYLGNISYRLEVIFEPDNVKTHPRLKYKQNLIVRTFQTQFAQQVAPLEIRTEVKTCCCCKRGYNTMNVSFEKDWYAPGEIAKVKIRVDNAGSMLDIKDVSFALVQKLYIHSDGKNIEKKVISARTNLAGIPKGGSMGEQEATIQLPPLQDGDYSMAKRGNMKSYLLGLPENNKIMHCATKGKLIVSEYFLDVFCPMSGCCSSEPKCRLPIQIYHPDVQFPPLVAPNGWNPVEMPVANVAMGAPMQQNQQVSVSVTGMTMTAPSSEKSFSIEMGNNLNFTERKLKEEAEYQPPGQFGQQEYGQNYFGQQNTQL